MLEFFYWLGFNCNKFYSLLFLFLSNNEFRNKRIFGFDLSIIYRCYYVGFYSIDLK